MFFFALVKNGYISFGAFHVVSFVAQVVDNIIASPADVKFRELRSNNKTIQRAILGCQGGREFLHLLGFEKITKHAESVYFLAEPQLEHLAQAKGWLLERVKACEETEGASAGRVCADSVLTILLTSGQTLEGGFYKHETVRDVYAFLQASVVSGGEELRLCTLKAPSTELGEEMLPLTLKDAKLLPRAALAVVKPTAATAAAATAAAALPTPSRSNRDASEEEKDEAMAKFKADRAKLAAAPRASDGGVEVSEERSEGSGIHAEGLEVAGGFPWRGRSDGCGMNAVEGV
eukprot:jgi/Undpi1/11476/HiC_scaffold_30.g13773.m1